VLRLATLLAVLFLILLAWAATPGSVSFDDVTARSGINFVLRNAASPEKHQIETMVGGVALFDYDGDGLLDIFLTNGARQPDLLGPSHPWNPPVKLKTQNT
jgi:enediyne biosynthesis protein E4